MVFKHDEPVTIEPGGKLITVLLKYANKEAEVPYGAKLLVQVIDAETKKF